MYFLSCTSIVWNRGYHSIFVCYCVVIEVERRTGHFDNNLAGTENDLNHVLSTFVDSEHEITNFCYSQYVDMSEIHSIFQNSPKEFLILTLNIHSVHAKFNNFLLLTTLLLKVYILERFVCKRHGLPVIPICRYYNYLDTNLFTRAVNVLSTVAWLYMRITIMKYEIYIPIQIYGKVCLSISMEATFAAHLQLGIYTDLLTIMIIM